MRADGTLYEEKGTLDFSDYSVNPTTGAVAFRGRVANPSRLLLPGMFVNVRLTVGTMNKGFRVPQLAVQRDGQGPYVLVVGADGVVAQKRVEIASVVGNDSIVTSGLADGDQVIVIGRAEGRSRARRRKPRWSRLPARSPPARPGSRRNPRRPPNPPEPPLVRHSSRKSTHSMAQFFIDRPVFAWVIAILISLGGVLAIRTLPAEAYPDVAPPQVSINATYPGANADTVERTVIQVIEQQLTGIDNLMYFSSSASNGGGSITLVFETGTDPDIAAVQTQNRVALAEPRLPRDVVLQGLQVAKVNSGFLMAVSLRSKDNSVPADVLNNIVAAQVLDPISRIPGVGQTQQFGAEYSMRIWLNPDKLRSFGMSAAEIADRVRGQNVQFATGALGEQPAVAGQQVTASVSAEGQFSSIEEFENVILRTEPNGTSVRLKDVARVELGLNSYAFDVRLDDQPVAGFGVLLSPGANALEVAATVEARMDQLSRSFPPGVEWFLPFDATIFIDSAIHEVVVTLCIAVVLVFIVMLVFLQSFRATIIPTLVVPVALMGAFIGMALFDFSINQLTLFGMVLAIGIVVDDAIVVIESVERIMREEHLSPKEATRKAMTQITNPIIAISVVLAAVFVPSALQSGSVGMIYQQFAMTIAISMGFSAFLALSLTPALCATMLRAEHLKENTVFRVFNRGYGKTQESYLRSVKFSLRHQRFWLGGFLLLLLVGGYAFTRVPGSFVPEEDQGFAIGMVMMPAGTSQPRTREFMRDVSDQTQAERSGPLGLRGDGFQLHRQW